MCELIFRHQNQEITYDEFLTHAAYKLMKMKPSKKSESDYQTELILKPKKENLLIYMIAELVKFL
jgi:predicted CopG family antitoxin